MRILFVTAGFIPDGLGGVELSLARFCHWAQGEGHEVLVFRRFHDPDLEEFAVQESEVEGIPVVAVNYRFGDAHDFLALVRNPTIRGIYEGVMQGYRPDLVHVHHLTCLTTEIVDASEAAGVPVVLSLHDYWMGCPRGQRIMADLTHCPEIEPERCIRCYRETWGHWFPPERDRIEEQRIFGDYHGRIREVLEKASVLLVPSQFARDVYARYGVSPERTEIVEYGMDTSIYEGLERVSEPRFRVGYLGSILPSKGVHILIDAFKRVGSSDMTLHLHGEVLPFHLDHDYGTRLEALVAGWESQVTFHGPYAPPEAPGILARLDALVVPSIWYETYCMVIREGFLAGVPVIASNFGAMAEAIDDGRTGLLFQVGDSVDLAEKLALLLKDRALGRRLAAEPKTVRTTEENGRHHVNIYERQLRDG